MKPIVFLGGGRITTALLAGLCLAKYSTPIVVHDRHSQKLRRLRREFSVVAEPNLGRAVDLAGVLLIAVRPDSVRRLLEEIGPLRKPVIAVSLAAGIPLAQLNGFLGPRAHWARAMPSPACRTRRGLTAVTFPRSVSQELRAQVKKFFSHVGPVLEIPESKFDAFTVAYSCSHGYHALASLAGGAMELGLDRKTALTAAAHALADGILSWREGNMSLEKLLHEAATPGGIAASAMEAMDDAGFQHGVERGLQAGLAKAKANARRW
jgi:pyrroline-5-carboxylate reductase